MDICLLWVLCVVRYRSLWWADHSSRGVLPTVVRHVWSRKPQEWGGHDPRWVAAPQKKIYIYIYTYIYIGNVKCNYYISNKSLHEKCDKEENVDVTGAAATFCLKRRSQHISSYVTYSPSHHQAAVIPMINIQSNSYTIYTQSGMCVCIHILHNIERNKKKLGQQWMPATILDTHVIGSPAPL
jgi:hypothetical protein